jgi:hypothetical protein
MLAGLLWTTAVVTRMIEPSTTKEENEMNITKWKMSKDVNGRVTPYRWVGNEMQFLCDEAGSRYVFMSVIDAISALRMRGYL